MVAFEVLLYNYITRINKGYSNNSDVLRKDIL